MMDHRLSQPAMAGNYTDFSGLARLKSMAGQNQQAAVGEVAQQFEGLLLQMLVQEMRKAMPSDGLFGSEAVKTYQDLADKQLALNMAKRGDMGIASMLEQQLQQQGMLRSADSTPATEKSYSLQASGISQQVAGGKSLPVPEVKAYDRPMPRPLKYFGVGL